MTYLPQFKSGISQAPRFLTPDTYDAGMPSINMGGKSLIRFGALPSTNRLVFVKLRESRLAAAHFVIDVQSREVLVIVIGISHVLDKI